MSQLPVPDADRRAVERFVAEHFAHLTCDAVAGSTAFFGGQQHADSALAAFDVRGYANGRNEVAPPDRRAASMLSPYIRHGLLPLRRVWDAVEGGPDRDVRKFRDELLWQEDARHWYAANGGATQRGLRRELPIAVEVVNTDWDRSMACIDASLNELEKDGWLVNQSRMWLASHWAVRSGNEWRPGEDAFFQHLLDGSRAANRLGWQWTTGVGSSKPYGFSRWQVNKRAPGLCASCEHESDCPIEDWPADPDYLESNNPAVPVTMPQMEPSSHLSTTPDAVWLTAESLGDEDPALVAHPSLPAVFVFDEPLLHRLQLSSKRLIFFVETLAELAHSRSVELHLGQPVDVLRDRSVAVTAAPVPGFAVRAAAIKRIVSHPWPWLCEPVDQRVRSFSGWRKRHQPR